MGLSPQASARGIDRLFLSDDSTFRSQQVSMYSGPSSVCTLLTLWLVVYIIQKCPISVRPPPLSSKTPHDPMGSRANNLYDKHARTRNERDTWRTKHIELK